MTTVATPITRQYPCVILRTEHCPLFSETVVSLSIALSEAHSTIIDFAAVPSQEIQASPTFRLKAGHRTALKPPAQSGFRRTPPVFSGGKKTYDAAFARLPRAMNPHFRLFGLPEQFDIDSEALQRTYRRLAAQFHPDKTAAASAFEQKQAVMMAAAVNEAYRLLADPLHRAALLLQAQGIEADAPEHTAFAPEFLLRQMAWREALADARAAQDQAALSALAAEISAEEAALHRSLAADFGAQAYEAAAGHVRQGRFLAKLRQEIRDAQAL